MSGVYCCVHGCTSHGRKKDQGTVSYFRIPAVVKREGKETEELTKARRLSWIKAINRKGLTMAEADKKPWLRVCSAHFHGGKPAYKELQNHPDWAPTLNMGYGTDTDTSSYERLVNRKRKRQDKDNTNRPSKGCNNRSGDGGYRMYTIPRIRYGREGTSVDTKVLELSKRRQQLWLKAVGREDLEGRIKGYHKVCQDHFVYGKPAYHMLENDPDWVPSRMLGFQEQRQFLSKSEAKPCKKHPKGKKQKRREVTPADSHQDLQVSDESTVMEIQCEPADELCEESPDVSVVYNDNPEVEEHHDSLAEKACPETVSHLETPAVFQKPKQPGPVSMEEGAKETGLQPVMMFSKSDILTPHCEGMFEKGPSIITGSKMQFSVIATNDGDVSMPENGRENCASEDTEGEQNFPVAEDLARQVYTASCFPVSEPQGTENHQACGTLSVLEQGMANGEQLQVKTVSKDDGDGQATNISYAFSSGDRCKSNSIQQAGSGSVPCSDNLAVVSSEKDPLAILAQTISKRRKAASRSLNYCGPPVLQPNLLKQVKANPGSLPARSLLGSSPAVPLFFIPERASSDSQAGNVLKYCCATCRQKFVSEEALEGHQCSSEKEPRSNSCIVCGSSHISIEALHKHMRHHLILNVNVFACHVCGRLFEDARQLERHRELHHIVLHKCETCGMTFMRKSNFDYHMKEMHSEQPHSLVCRVCGKVYKKLQHLNAHLKLHSETRHECRVCGKAFGFKKLFTKHLIKCSGERRYQCELCGKCFIYGTNFKDHMDNHRGTKRRYTCPVCGKVLNSKDGLKGHVLAHKGPPPFKCHLCEKGYFSPGNLKNHMKDKHGSAPLAELASETSD